MKHETLNLVLGFAAMVALMPAAQAGQFKDVTYYKVGSHQQPRQVVAAHLTHSGNLDLAITDYVSEKVNILLTRIIREHIASAQLLVRSGL
jgi:hypothetical protein